MATTLKPAIDYYNGVIYTPQISHIIIALGTNDFQTGVPSFEMEENYKTIISFAHPNTKVGCIKVQNSYSFVQESVCPSMIRPKLLPEHMNGIHYTEEGAAVVAQSVRNWVNRNCVWSCE
jgi:hypothetical protein